MVGELVRLGSTMGYFKLIVLLEGSKDYNFSPSFATEIH